MLAIYLSALNTDEDKALFEQLYIKYRQDMYAIAYSILRNKEDAENAVHQSFVKIANNFTKVSQKPRNKIKTYIVIISKNTAINLYNKNKILAERSVSADNIEIVDDSYFEHQDYNELRNAISELPSMYKDVIYLYCLQEFSANETAELLDISANLVRQRANRAKKMLKDKLERNCNNE